MWQVRWNVEGVALRVVLLFAERTSENTDIDGAKVCISIIPAGDGGHLPNIYLSFFLSLMYANQAKEEIRNHVVVVWSLFCRPGLLMGLSLYRRGCIYLSVIDLGDSAGNSVK